jgi:hypothetical protein
MQQQETIKRIILRVNDTKLDTGNAAAFYCSISEIQNRPRTCYKPLQVTHIDITFVLLLNIINTNTGLQLFISFY